MKRTLWLMLGMGGVLLLMAPAAQAVPITVQFQVSDLHVTSYSSSEPAVAPQDPVSGTIVYDADSMYATTINSFTSIDLTIDGHTYALGEFGHTVSYDYYPDGVHWIYANAGNDGIDDPGLLLAFSDFSLQWHANTLLPLSFVYSSENHPGVAVTATPYQFTSFSVTESGSSAPVPEPSTMMLLGSGLVGLAGYGRRRLKK